ncbi:unnamed protein product [Mycena citricolor]|uniref:Uncharacterized protein n=1 Tax=Mycena citricolor TaxID=2018698 RepID=A0AAD2JXM3_9AGAR|nr:unnamed protein product [Mycena citricolor]CAK5265929.1 unnamed protein product [Mycena citricolor]
MSIQHSTSTSMPGAFPRAVRSSCRPRRKNSVTHSVASSRRSSVVSHGDISSSSSSSIAASLAPTRRRRRRSSTSTFESFTSSEEKITLWLRLSAFVPMMLGIIMSTLSVLVITLVPSMALPQPPAHGLEAYEDEIVPESATPSMFSSSLSVEVPEMSNTGFASSISSRRNCRPDISIGETFLSCLRYKRAILRLARPLSIRHKSKLSVSAKAVPLVGNERGQVSQKGPVLPRKSLLRLRSIFRIRRERKSSDKVSFVGR